MADQNHYAIVIGSGISGAGFAKIAFRKRLKDLVHENTLYYLPKKNP